MATADQVVALIDSHAKKDRARFLAVSHQIMATESAAGHYAVVERMRRSMELMSVKDLVVFDAKNVDILRGQQPTVKLADVILRTDQRAEIEAFLLEHLHRDQLLEHGIRPASSLLLTGPTGTGKTMTTNAIAEALGLPLYVVSIPGLVDSHLGVTGRNLQRAFDQIAQCRAVYLFDECDALLRKRGGSGDAMSVEMARTVNAFLMMMDQNVSGCVLVGTTNLVGHLDSAAVRRFDSVVRYGPPDAAGCVKLAVRAFAACGFTRPEADVAEVLERVPADCLTSHATIVVAAETTAKHSIIHAKPLDLDRFRVLLCTRPAHLEEM